MIDAINRLAERINMSVNIMEVCGTHTVAIQKAGLKHILARNLRLVSGPGCPVCVTPKSFIDKAITYLRQGYHIFTFGDMLKVPGSFSSLQKEDSAKVHVVYSPLESVKFAKDNPQKKSLFLGIGFETTSPLIAALVKERFLSKAGNLFLLCSCKLMPPALKVLLDDKDLNIDGFILPGHVSAVIGRNPYREVFSRSDVCGSIAGFETEDILLSIKSLLEMIYRKENDIKIQYSRVVKEEGNKYAQDQISQVFDRCDTAWRGLGVIPESGLRLKREFCSMDIETLSPLKNIESKADHIECKCSEVIKGKLSPKDCKLFGKVCLPQNPVGPCMVSSEGACAAYYKYGG